MSEKKKEELNLLILQWKELHNFQEKIDSGHMTVFAIFFGALGIASAFKDYTDSIFFWIMPPIIMVIFFYEAYRLNEANLVKEYLRYLEKQINTFFRRITKPKRRAKCRKRI